MKPRGTRDDHRNTKSGGQRCGPSPRAVAFELLEKIAGSRWPFGSGVRSRQREEIREIAKGASRITAYASRHAENFTFRHGPTRHRPREHLKTHDSKRVHIRSLIRWKLGRHVRRRTWHNTAIR